MSGDVEQDDRSNRLHRATIEFGLDDAQAEQFELLVELVEILSGDEDASGADLNGAADALDDPAVAEAAWTRWADEDLLGGPVEALVDELVDAFTATLTARGGVSWLIARHHAWNSRTADAISVLSAARDTGHTLVLCELAGVEADRSHPGAARDLLREGGIDVQIDLDAEYDPRTAASGFGPELAEEIAPFAAIRPKAMAGRNDRCPCGSGKKYKQCHIGNELHALEDRAGWLYVKLMRFMQVNSSLFPAVIADDLIDGVTEHDLRSMVHESYLPVDLALFEGGVAQWFLDAKRTLLPADEIELLESWIG
ncbi:MAG: YecA family protein, partial [Ilumatobacter sp.]